MESITFRCACCRCFRRRNPRVKNQHYCGDKRCQQARKNKWQREKQQTDPAYQANKRESQQIWTENNPDYWKQYRREHADYCRHNSEQQRRRDASCANLAKMDALTHLLHDTTASYLICPAEGVSRKKDALAVKIIPVSPG